MRKVFFIVSFCLIGYAAKAQNDTLKLTLSQIEQLFLNNNALLMARKFNIDANRAAEIQAKLWDNPTVSFEQMLYNNKTNRPLPILGLADTKGTPTTQQAINVQQLFLLAGKRDKRLLMAQTNTKMAEQSYFDLLRGLKYDLRSSFNNLYHNINTLRVLNEEILSISSTLDGMSILFDKGVIPKKDIVRMKALLFSLYNDRKDILQEISANQINIKLFAQLKPEVVIIPLKEAKYEDKSTVLPPLGKVIEFALENRPDYELQRLGFQMEQQNLGYQKALRTPDLRAGVVYDRSGSSVPNYFGANFQIDIPVFNKNQGNIKMAEYNVEAAKKMVENSEQRIYADAQLAYSKAVEADRLYKTYDASFIKEYDNFLDIIREKYQKQIISMLEFIDFYESYKITTFQMNKLLKDRANAFEEINFVAGKEILK